MRIPPIPHERWRGFAERENEIVRAVFVKIADDARGLLSRGAGSRQVTGGAREMLPLGVGCLSCRRNNEEEEKD